VDGFDHILNWKLTYGSHRFPGKDGGTCITKQRSSQPVSTTSPCVGSRICRIVFRAPFAA
jgi:hypothetical protein